MRTTSRCRPSPSADATLASNRTRNDLTVTAGGDIVISWASAGMSFTNSASVPAPGPGAAAGVTSLGDVILTAGGEVREQGTDAGVDLVAHRLTVTAPAGCSGLEVAVNEIDLQTSGGSIELQDLDAPGETRPGLVIVSAQAPAGSVTVTAQNYVEVQRVAATGADSGTARLTSTDGSLTVVKPASGDAIHVARGIALAAAHRLESYAFFQASDLVEYRAGDDYDFDTSSAALGLPSTLRSQTVILERLAGVEIDQPLTVNAQRFELLSDANVFVTANLVGTIGELAITARGLRTVRAPVYNEATGQMLWGDQPSGILDIQAAQLGGDRWDFRAAREVYLELSNRYAVRGFIGGLPGFGPVDDVTLKTPGTLTLRGGIS